MRSLLLALLLAASSAFAADNLPLFVRAVEPHGFDASDRATWRFVVVNRSSVRQNGVAVSVTTPGDIVALPEGCTRLNSSYAQCVVDVPAGGQSAELAFTVQHPVATSALGRKAVTVSLRTPSITSFRFESAFAHDYLVTNTNDSGPGSLREAIAAVNAACVGPQSDPCRIAFDIQEPLPRSGWYTIAPHLPLAPVLGHDVTIDGLSQSRDYGAPRVMLDGRLTVKNCSGLTLSCDYCTVSGLAIGWFPESGINVVSSSSFELYRNYLGVNPSGLTAAPNGWRGVQAYYGYSRINDNVISANGRAGIFLLESSSSAISLNLVGTGADGVTPLGNSASGIYVDAPPVPASARYPAQARNVFISDNVVAYNAQAGIATSPFSEIAIGRNTLFHNARLGIDVYLNGPGGPEPPTIRSATYADGVTTIVGTVTSPSSVRIYANGAVKRDGTAEAEELIADLSSAVGTPFTVTVPRDLRGRYITAQSTTRTVGQPPVGCQCDIPEIHVYSSELSSPTLVR